MIINRVNLRENSREYKEQVMCSSKTCRFTCGAFEYQNWGKSLQSSDLGTKCHPVELNATCLGCEKSLLCFFSLQLTDLSECMQMEYLTSSMPAMLELLCKPKLYSQIATY